MAKYDFLIKNGIVFDGSKDADPKQINIGIKDEHIKEIGDINEAESLAVIDASNQYVCPGFIDLTSHSDAFWTIFSDPFQESLITQGITTILGGNCGSSLAPIVSQKDIQSIQKWTDISTINIDWQELKEFFDRLDKIKIGVNFATLIGHGTLRRNIAGDETRSLTETEIRKLIFLLEKALEQGAFGVSFNLGSAHEKETSEKEITAIQNIVKKFGGLIKHHLEDEGKNILPALAKVISGNRETKSTVQISHFKAIGKTAWEKFDEAMSLIERARNDGLNITVDVFPYTKTGSNLYVLLPEWIIKNGKDYILSSLKKLDERNEALVYLKTLTLHYDKITIASALHDKNSIGKTLADISKATGFSPEEVILNLLEINDLQVSIFNEVIKEEHIEKLLAEDYVMIATDGSGYDAVSADKGLKSSNINNPHPRSFGTFPKFFREFVRNKQILNWQNAVYKASGFPAKVLGIKDRGIIKEGAFADIVIFNPEIIQDNATYHNPFRFSSGVNWVFINGTLVLKEGELTRKKAGIVLRKR